MKGMTTCKVCGQDFPLTAEKHYIAQDPQKIGVFANLANTDRATEYDAFDCPHCGCQNIMQERKSLWMPEEFECGNELEESEEKTDSKKESKETDKSVADMREFLIGYCTGRFCTNCPLDKSGFLCGRGYSFRASVPGTWGYMSDEQIKRHYEVVKEEK